MRRLRLCRPTQLDQVNQVRAIKTTTRFKVGDKVLYLGDKEDEKEKGAWGFTSLEYPGTIMCHNSDGSVAVRLDYKRADPEGNNEETRQAYAFSVNLRPVRERLGRGFAVSACARACVCAAVPVCGHRSVRRVCE